MGGLQRRRVAAWLALLACPGGLRAEESTLGFGGAPPVAGSTGAASSAAAEADSGALALATLVWPPYVGPDLPEEGLATAIAAAAAQRLGRGLRVEFFPWKRAMQVGAEDPAFAGYFPAYYTEERARAGHFSEPIGHSTLGLACLEDDPLQWERLSDLRDKRIGVVSGYSNGPEFDALVRAGVLQVDASPRDALSLRKLLEHRVRAVAIDRTVLRYLLLSDPTLAADRERIVFQPRPIAELSLHVGFQHTARGLRLRQDFDAALRRLDLARIEQSFFQRLAAPRPASSPGR